MHGLIVRQTTFIFENLKCEIEYFTIEHVEWTSAPEYVKMFVELLHVHSALLRQARVGPSHNWKGRLSFDCRLRQLECIIFILL